MEPTSTTATSAGLAHSVSGVGLMALLMGMFGDIAADVIMVVLASCVGCMIALSSSKTATFWSVVKYMAISVITSLVLAWALAAALISYMPSLDSIYTPSLIALAIGGASEKLPKIFNGVISKIESKLTSKAQ